MKRVFVRLSGENPTGEELRSCFAGIFRHLDACPEELLVHIAPSDGWSVDFTRDMNPLFTVGDAPPAAGCFRGRWLPEHPVPLVFPARRAAYLSFRPTTGNRAKVARISRARAFLRAIKPKWSKK